MQGTQPAVGRRKASRSSEKSLYSRLILLNMRTDLKRVVVTVVSVAGCCMLLVIGFTLRYGMSRLTDRQFGQIVCYEAEVFYDAATADAAAGIEKILDENGLDHVNVRKADSIFRADETLNTATLIVAEKGALDGFYGLEDVINGGAITLPDSGTLVSKRFWEYYGTDVGESFTIYDARMNLNETKVAGVFNNYFGQLMFLTPQGYTELFGSKPENNCFLVKTGGMSLSELQQKVAEVEGFVSVNDATAERTRFNTITGTLSYVVILMIVMAGMMAYFILMNLSMTYIQRKSPELTIMRINGFTVKECVRYAAVDLIITTILGTVLGLILGQFLGDKILRMVEMPYMQLVRDPAVQSFVFSALITVAFSVLINSYALRRVRDLKLSDMS